MYSNLLKKSTTVKPLAEAFVKDFRKQRRAKNLDNDLDNITVKQKEIINYILTLISSPESPSAYSSLQRRISNLGSPEITQRYIEFHTETGNQPSDIRKEIESLVQKLTGRKNSMALTADENKKWAENDTKKQIGKLRSQYTEAVRQTVKQIVLSSGKPQILISDVMKQLKARNVGVTPYPAAFENSTHIYVNLNAELCNVNGDVLAAKSMSPTFKFELNKKYDPNATGKGNNWLYKAVNPETGGANYIGLVVKSATAKGEKFEKLVDMLTSNKIEGIKKKWRKYMVGKDLDNFDTVASMLTEYLYVTSSRIGSDEAGGNTGGVTTYGASNFPRSALKIPADGSIPKKVSIVHYVKGGHIEKMQVDPAKSDSSLDKVAKQRLIAFLVAKSKDKKPNDPVFTVKGKRISPTAYNTWLKTHTTLTAHNFRTLRGSEIALTLVPEAKAKVEAAKKKVAPKKLADKVVHDIFKGVMLEVGKVLGHIRRNKDGTEENTANTAIQYYVSPTIFLQFYKDIGYAPPAALIAAARKANIDI